MLRQLIDVAKVDLHATESKGFTAVQVMASPSPHPLMSSPCHHASPAVQYAAYVGNVEALGFLLERGADCDAARSCEQLAGMQGHDAAVKFLGRRAAQAAKRAKRQARKRANKGQGRQAAAEAEQPPGAAGKFGIAW